VVEDQVLMVVEEVELEDIELLVMVQVHYKEQHKV
tara:strand:- start:579 stop:683 length:105 start_codon:yes stop_codon:yes gene_type:complete